MSRALTRCLKRENDDCRVRLLDCNMSKLLRQNSDDEPSEYPGRRQNEQRNQNQEREERDQERARQSICCVS